MDCLGTYFTHVQPNVTHVQSATQWTASVHTLHTPKPNVTHVQSATQWTASVHTLHTPLATLKKKAVDKASSKTLQRHSRGKEKIVHSSARQFKLAGGDNLAENTFCRLKTNLRPREQCRSFCRLQ